MPPPRQRVQADAAEDLVLEREVDRRLLEQAAQHGHLRVEATPAPAERLAEGLVLLLVPADAEAEPQAAAGEEVDLCRLLRGERGLALGEDHDPGRQLDALRGGGEEPEEHERLVPLAARVVVGIGAPPDDVVEHHEVGEAGLLGGHGERAHRARVGPDLVLRDDQADAHARQVGRLTRRRSRTRRRGCAGGP